MLDRRQFLDRSLRTGVAAAAAAPFLGRPARSAAAAPIDRSGAPRFHLALAAYSFRQFFAWSRGKAQTPPGGRMPLDMTGFVDFCAEHGVAAELTSYFFPPDVTDDDLRALKRHAFLGGVPVSGTAVGNEFTHPPGEAREAELAYVRAWIDRAAVLGAPHVRVFAGAARTGQSEEEAFDLCVAALRECCAHAASRGVVLGLENHGGIVAEPDTLLRIVEAVDSPWFGINLDTGNFHTADPYDDLARCAPWAVNVQVKVEMRPAGKPAERADFDRIAALLREARYQGFVALEYEASGDPFEAVPRELALLREALGKQAA